MKFHIGGINDLETDIRRADRGPTMDEKLGLGQAIEDGLMKSQNYRDVHNTGQGTWTPLNPKYVARKQKSGFSTKIWVLTGNSFEALTTPIKILGKRGHNRFGRKISVKSISKTLFRTTIEYSMHRPASSGWPKRRAKNSYFLKNDLKRPFLEHITARGENEVLDQMMDVVIRFMTRVFK